MVFKIGDTVRTNMEHYIRYSFTFEGIIDDIEDDIISVYGRVIEGLETSENKYLRDLHVRTIFSLEPWFEGFCSTCRKIKLVHNDIRDTLGDPGFICKDCEENGKAIEKMMYDMLY